MATQIHRVIPGGPQAPAVEVGERGTIEANNTGYLIYQVTDGRKLKLGTIIATSQLQSNALLRIFDCTSTTSNRILQLVIGANKTEILAPEDLIGVKEAISGIYCISDLSGVFVHIGGFESPA